MRAIARAKPPSISTPPEPPRTRNSPTPRSAIVRSRGLPPGHQHGPHPTPDPPPMPPRQTAFTLIELLIAVAIVGILLGVALPGFAGAMEAARAQETKSALLASITRSVNRAAITGTRAVLCPSADGQGCGAGFDWSQGWIGFLDRNANRERDTGETLLLQQPALPGKVRLRTTSGRTRIVFQGNGGNAGSNVTFTLCDGRGTAKAETLVLNNRGGMRYGTPTPEAAAACTAN